MRRLFLAPAEWCPLDGDTEENTPVGLYYIFDDDGLRASGRSGSSGIILFPPARLGDPIGEGGPFYFTPIFS